MPVAVVAAVSVPPLKSGESKSATPAAGAIAIGANIKGKLAFCPISQLDSKHVEGTGEELAASLFGWANRALEATAEGRALTRRTCG